MQIDKEQIRYLAVVLVIALGFALGIWWPAQMKRSRLHTRIAKERQQIQQAVAVHRDMKRWYRKIVGLRRQLRHFPSHAPDPGQLAQVLRQLSAALTDASVDDQDVTTRSANSVGKLMCIPIDVRFRGSFPAAYQVLRHVETMHAFVRVDDLQIHRPNRDAGGGDLRVQLRLNTFFAANQRGS